MENLAVRVDEETKDTVADLAEQRGESSSEVARELINSGLSGGNSSQIAVDAWVMSFLTTRFGPSAGFAYWKAIHGKTRGRAEAAMYFLGELDRLNRQNVELPGGLWSALLDYIRPLLRPLATGTSHRDERTRAIEAAHRFYFPNATDSGKNAWVQALQAGDVERAFKDGSQ